MAEAGRAALSALLASAAALIDTVRNHGDQLASISADVARMQSSLSNLTITDHDAGDGDPSPAFADASDDHALDDHAFDDGSDDDDGEVRVARPVQRRRRVLVDDDSRDAPISQRLSRRSARPPSPDPYANMSWGVGPVRRRLLRGRPAHFPPPAAQELWRRLLGLRLPWAADTAAQPAAAAAHQPAAQAEEGGRPSRQPSPLPSQRPAHLPSHPPANEPADQAEGGDAEGGVPRDANSTRTRPPLDVPYLTPPTPFLEEELASTSIQNGTAKYLSLSVSTRQFTQWSHVYIWSKCGYSRGELFGSRCVRMGARIRLLFELFPYIQESPPGRTAPEFRSITPDDFAEDDTMESNSLIRFMTGRMHAMCQADAAGIASGSRRADIDALNDAHRYFFYQDFIWWYNYSRGWCTVRDCPMSEASNRGLPRHAQRGLILDARIGPDNNEMAPTFERRDHSLPHYADNCLGVMCKSCNTKRWANYVKRIRAEHPI